MFVCPDDRYWAREAAVVPGLAAIAEKLGAPPDVAVGGSRSMTWQPMHQCSASVPPTPGDCAAAGSGSINNAIAIVLRICFTMSRHVAALISADGRLAGTRVFSLDLCQSGRIQSHMELQ
jgi:hypothetical protein